MIDVHDHGPAMAAEHPKPSVEVESTKVLFLDIDGVLNSHAFYRKRDGELAWNRDNEIDATAVVLLNAVRAPIVVSSTWRLFVKLPELRRLLAAHGFTGRIIGVTPEIPGRPRSDEIRHWLDRHPEVTSYAIVDDDSDANIADHFVRTDGAVGLTVDDVARINQILG